MNTSNAETIYLMWTVPLDAPSGPYGFLTRTWGSCWPGCEALPCFADGCCSDMQDEYDEVAVFEVL